MADETVREEGSDPPTATALEDVDAGAIDALRAGEPGAVQFIGARIFESLSNGTLTEAMRQFLRDTGAALAHGASLHEAFGLPLPRGRPRSQTASNRTSDVALYYHLCRMRGMPERDAKERAADAFAIENVDRAIRGTSPPHTDGPGDRWDRYFAGRIRAKEKFFSLPPKPPRSQDTK